MCMSESENNTTRTILRPRGEPGLIKVDVTTSPTGARAAVSGAKVTVGRSRAADLHVADPAVSEFHFEAESHAEGIEVRDLESWNGTYFEGARIERAIVPSGATLSVGESVVRLEAFAHPGDAQPARESFGGLLGKSRVMRDLFLSLATLARTAVSVLIEGPTGSGKELAARGLHAEGTRAQGPFVVLDCAAIPGQLAESLLFGHERGSFTGAIESRPGVFEAADGGTVFLDEVGELPIELQPRLLRAVEQRQVTRLGSNTPRAFDVRIVSATWRDLRRMVNQGQFREDLYYRLAQARVLMPALCDRREDIELLAADVLRRLPPNVRCARQIARSALDQLRRRDFPGNVRELRNALEVAACTSEGEIIRPADLAFERLMERSQTAQRGTSWDEDDDVPEFKGAKRTAIDDFEHQYLQRLLGGTEGNIARAAALAGVERHYLRALLKKHGLHGGSPPKPRSR
jgi:DNA-binding NtrC family response regulator